MLSPEMSAESSEPIAPKSRGRSRVTNGSTLLVGTDGRSSWARRMRDVLSLHIQDMGGAENISEAERSITRRAATLTVELENMESQFATAGSATVEQLDAYQRAANSLRRLLESVGLQRRARDISPTLAQFLAPHLVQDQGTPPAAEPAHPVLITIEEPAAAPAPSLSLEAQEIQVAHSAPPEPQPKRAGESQPRIGELLPVEGCNGFVSYAGMTPNREFHKFQFYSSKQKHVGTIGGATIEEARRNAECAARNVAETSYTP